MTLQKILKNDKHAKNIGNLFKRQRIRIKMKGLLQINKKKKIQQSLSTENGQRMWIGNPQKRKLKWSLILF